MDTAIQTDIPDATAKELETQKQLFGLEHFPMGNWCYLAEYPMEIHTNEDGTAEIRQLVALIPYVFDGPELTAEKCQSLFVHRDLVVRVSGAV